MKIKSIANLFLLFSSIAFAQNIFRVSTDYSKLNLNPSNVPEIWEDGLRTNAGPRSFEWWYVDTCKVS